MSNGFITLECDNCNTINESDARFCKKCGSTLSYKIQKCKKCGVVNDTEAVYCKSCGANLRDATIGVTSSRAKEWWDSLNNFEFYKRLWYQGGAGHYIHNQCKQFKDSDYPNIQWEAAAFLIPITSIDWCIKSLFVGKTEITNGELLCTTSEVIIFDIKTRRVKVFPYQQISKVELNKLQQGLTLQIYLVDNSIIYAFLKENAPTGVYVTATANLVGTLFNSWILDKKESLVDEEIKDRRVEEANKVYTQNYQTGYKFWQNIVIFFNEVLSRA